MKRDFPSLQEIQEIHRDLIEQFGGVHGLRDIGALESALMRPQLGYYKDILEEAAALFESLAMNHPFIDGNKRVAFFATDTFLRMNGYFINCDNEETYSYLMELFDKQKLRFDVLAIWLFDHVEKSR
jgi:death-on-curing protein